MLNTNNDFHYVQCKPKWVYLFIQKGQSSRWQPTHLYTQIHKIADDRSGIGIQEVQLVISAFMLNFCVLRHFEWDCFHFIPFFSSHNEFSIHFIYHGINHFGKRNNKTFIHGIMATNAIQKSNAHENMNWMVKSWLAS